MNEDNAPQDRYEVQTRKMGRKYQTKLATNNKGQALMHYEGWNMGKGYRKRLLMNGKVYKRHDGVE